jgi:hypothetical protein
MPFCSKCGFKVEGEDSFCARCGAEIREVPIVDEHKVGWKNKEDESFWKIFKKSIGHAFFDNEEKLSKNRKIANVIIIVLILVIGISIFGPSISSNFKLTYGKINNLNSDGSCKYRLDARNVELTDVYFSTSDLTMNFLVVNDKKESVVVERIAKTYEYQTDNRGETEIEEINQRVPANSTLNITFSLKEEPHIIGLEFSNCEKGKISDWHVLE